MIKGIHRIFVLIMTIANIEIILSQDQPCKSIEYCELCPNQNICDKCELGFILNSNHTKCLNMIENLNLIEVNRSSLNNQYRNQPIQNQSQSQINQIQNNQIQNNQIQNNQNSPIQMDSSPNNINNNINNNIVKASNAPVASNAPIASNEIFTNANDVDLNSVSKFQTIIFLIILLIIGLLLIFITIWLIKKKKERMSEFYDESGNQDENEQVVEIK